MICRVPATSANMGPGFDSLGVALTLWAEIGLIDASGEIPHGAHSADDNHLATVAFRRLGGEGMLWVRSPIPMGRGLGYSAAVRLGGLLLACAQRGLGPDDTIAQFGLEAVHHASALEGHADNAAPALLGGVVATTGERSVRVPLGFDPAIVVWVPSFSTRTDQSRAKLGDSIPLADAVFNIGRTAVLVAALAAGDVDALRDTVDDRIHQPLRFAAVPESHAAYEAALAAGAWCAWLSGSGPAVAAMCSIDAAPTIAAALPADGHAKVLRIDHGGATLEPM
jgi:homoserine kinase